MATAKYKRDKNGYFHTMAWDGTYTETGQKHRIHLRTRQSSAALEKMVADLARRVEDGKVVRKTDLSFAAYAAQWAQVKSVYTRNTQRQYDDIIKYYIRHAPVINCARKLYQFVVFYPVVLPQFVRLFLRYHAISPPSPNICDVLVKALFSTQHPESPVNIAPQHTHFQNHQVCSPFFRWWGRSCRPLWWFTLSPFSQPVRR